MPKKTVGGVTYHKKQGKWMRVKKYTKKRSK